jgi:hypothetical protein
MAGEIDPTVYANMMANESKEKVLSAIKDLVNADQIVEDIRFQLSGIKQVKIHENGQLVVKKIKYHEALMNEYGINKVISDFRAFINPNVILSYLERDDIKARSRSYYTNVSFELARNMMNYDIRTKENHAKVRTILGTNFHAALSRAYNGLTLITTLKNIQVQEVRNLDNEGQRGGFSGFGRKVFNK